MILKFYMTDDDTFKRRRYDQVIGERRNFQLSALTDPHALEELEAYVASRTPEDDILPLLIFDHKFGVPSCKYLLGILPKDHHLDIKPVISDIEDTIKSAEELDIVVNEPTLFHARKKIDNERTQFDINRLKDFNQEIRLYPDKPLYFLVHTLINSGRNVNWFDNNFYLLEKSRLENKLLEFFYSIDEIRRNSPSEQAFSFAYSELILTLPIKERVSKMVKPNYKIVPLVRELKSEITMYLLEDQNKHGSVGLFMDCNKDQVQISYSGRQGDNFYNVLLDNGLDRKAELSDFLR